MKLNRIAFYATLFLAISWGCSDQNKPEISQPPNVIFIITDDQGYGDLACLGNPWIKTPEMDKLFNESIRFSNYHCGTTCAPTRSGIMTGKYCNHVNVWHTIIGREILRKEEYTLANAFSDNGYATGMFGKWHLGDNYPYRPFDRGFDLAVWHKAGGVGQAPDYWGNNYFDDTYFRNAKPEKFEGYCTDIWFAEAMEFIETNKGKPFFCYLATNAPHGPFRVAKNYSQMYDTIPEIVNPSFYGMITNIDDNLGVLVQKLEEWGLKENTIFIFTTDNGTAAGVETGQGAFVTKGFGGGMRGKKGSKYDGGHRVPFFVRWPAKKWKGGIDLNTVASYTDVFPTLADWCKLEIPDFVEFDGISWSDYITGNEDKERVIFTDTQRMKELKKWKDCAVMTNKWRLVDGTELYDMEVDPGQSEDVAEIHHAVVENLRDEYETWWEEVSEYGDEAAEISVDFSKEHPVVLSSHDLKTDGPVTWNQNQVRQLAEAQGYWELNFAEDGEYEFRLYRWPAESGLALNAAAPAGELDEAGQLYKKGKAFNVQKAWMKINGEEEFVFKLNGSKSYVSFKKKISAGSHRLETGFMDDKGLERSAYYVHIL
jgi:arylsulfatase A-like enzyme